MDMMRKNGVEEPKSNKLKVMFFRKKALISVLLALAFAAVCVLGGWGIATATNSSVDKIKVVIDPGHGGIDNGVVGAEGTKESEFNLTMSLMLAEYLDGAGFEVLLTRETADGLYGDARDNFKRADMAARKKIIEDAEPDIVISIHANKYPGDSRRGAQVFFDEMSEDGQRLARCIQSSLNQLNLAQIGRSFEALKGDYYMLKCTKNPSVIVECGFLSNAEDEKLLCDDDYRKQLAFAVYSGLAGFLSDETAER